MCFNKRFNVNPTLVGVALADTSVSFYDKMVNPTHVGVILKATYPDDKERLKHIFEEQVYGMAPTEIIYRIATSYIFGFNKDMSIKDDHFVKCDALKCAQDGTLQDKIDEIFGCDNEEKTTDVNG